jgi:hypothetical protein
MADPVTWAAVIGGGAALGGAGMQAYGTYQQGKSEEALNKYNAELSRRQATAAEMQAQAQASRQQKQARAMQARQRVLLAKSGVATEGTPLMLLEKSAMNAELDRQTILREGNIQSDQFTSQALMDRMKAKSAKRAGTTGAIGSLLSGGGQVAQIGLAYKGAV